MQVGKTAKNAIAVMSYLAECERDKLELVSSQKVADARLLSKPLAAKILTTLSQAGYVTGSTGPKGGYKLAIPAKEITLLDVVRCFEIKNKVMECPFGAGWCGNHEPCAMHDDIAKLTEYVNRFLENHHFGCFSESEVCSKRPIND